MKLSSRLLVILFAAALFAACNNQSNTPKELKGISLNKQELELEMGDSYQLVVLYEPEDAEEGAPKVIWECTKERVATISATGRVEAKQKGRATIVATCGRFTAECKLEVVTGGSTPVVPPDPDKFSVTPTEIKAPAEGGTYTLTVKANIAWSATCEDDTWASISPASGEGDATITVTVQPNTVEKADEQDITFTAGDYTQYVTIRREGVSIPPKVYGFSVSATKQVLFAPGNLQYHPKNKEWRFAEHQRYIAGTQTWTIAEDYNGWIDMFCWGTGDQPLYRGKKSSFSEWGNHTINHGGSDTWYTLTKDQWDYIISKRDNAIKLNSQAVVIDVKGYILLPDNWELPEGVTFVAGANNYTDNVYNLPEWNLMEKAGAVFLPATGLVWKTDGEEERFLHPEIGYYWTSTADEKENEYAYGVVCRDDKVISIADYNEKKDMHAVRLVKTVK